MRTRYTADGLGKTDCGTEGRLREAGLPFEGFRTVKRETLRERIYAEVRRALQTGQFEPGEAITNKSLEEAIGAGAMPIRETLQRLVAEGALINLPNGRVRVPLLTAAEFDELKQIRLRLEGYAAQRAAVERTPAELEHIRQCWSLLAKALERQSSPADIIHRNYDFHFAIYKASHHGHLVSIIDGLWLRVSPLLSIPFKKPASARSEYVNIHEPRHLQLVDAIGAKKPKDAESAMKDIIEASAEWYHRHHEFAPDA